MPWSMFCINISWLSQVYCFNILSWLTGKETCWIHHAKCGCTLRQQQTKRLSPLSLYRSPDNRMILKQISKGDNHYLKKTAAILNGGWGCRTQFWLGKHQGTIYARVGPYIDASCQVWLHLAKLFQRRRFF